MAHDNIMMHMVCVQWITKLHNVMQGIILVLFHVDCMVHFYNDINSE